MSRSAKDDIETALADLTNRENEFAKACTDDAEKEHAYKIKFAKEYLKASGTIEEKKNSATFSLQPAQGRAF